jgi:hypothetical protein
MLQRQGDTGPCLTRGAAAHRVDDHHHGAGRFANERIDLLRGSEFLDAKPGQLFAHRPDE